MASSRILLVDDDELSLELITLILSADGHLVQGVATGSAALERLATGHLLPNSSKAPPIVLTDLHMPDMDGRELCRQIRGQPGAQPLVIAMSATRPPDDQLREFDAFVMKPLDPQEFAGVLAGRKGPRQPADTPVESGEAIDRVVLEKLRKLMPPGALDELFTIYLSDTRVRLTEMEAFAIAGDQAAVRRNAHMMKGSAAMTGATGMSRIAALLEAGNLPLDEQKVLFRELHCACDAIEGTLHRDARS